MNVNFHIGQALEAAQWVKLTSPGADLTIYAGDFNTEPGDVPYRILRFCDYNLNAALYRMCIIQGRRSVVEMLSCRCVGGLGDAWEAGQGAAGGGETCGTPQNTYW